VEIARKLEGTQKEFAAFMQTMNGGLKHAANGEADIFVGGVESREDILGRMLNLKKSIGNVIDFFRNLRAGKGPRFVKKAVPVRGVDGEAELSERWMRESIEGIAPYVEEAGISETGTKVVAVDFDGVINSYLSGWKGPTETDAPVLSAAESLKTLYNRGYKVIIFSTRANTQEGIDTIREYLRRHTENNELADTIEITDKKPIADMYIDDRAIPFNGDWEETLEKIETFEPWMAKGGFVEGEHPRAENGRFKEKGDPKDQISAIRRQYEGTDQWMKAPNGELTKLTEKQWLQVRTLNFKGWFGDWEGDPENASKVVDKNGEPLPVYHGTRKDKFSVFYTGEHTGYAGRKQSGAFFSADKDYANSYGENLTVAFLNVRKPLVTTEYPDISRLNDAIINSLEKKYDGVIFNDIADGTTYAPKEDSFFLEIAVFSPIQIKSATDNDGTFSIENPSIEKSLTYSGYPLQGRTKIQGMDISIENKKGSIRSGTDKDGHDWSIKMNFDYGYIRGTVGKDKDHVDCYVGPNPEVETVFIVHQNDPATGDYDEDKVMLGFDSEDEARKAYLSQYDRPGFLGDIDEMDIETFKDKAFDPKNKGKKLRG
jgi:hypothetical protein